jgi:hypothetical protein
LVSEHQGPPRIGSRRVWQARRVRVDAVSARLVAALPQPCRMPVLLWLDEDYLPKKIDGALTDNLQSLRTIIQQEKARARRVTEAALTDRVCPRRRWHGGGAKMIRRFGCVDRWGRATVRCGGRGSRGPVCLSALIRIRRLRRMRSRFAGRSSCRFA